MEICSQVNNEGWQNSDDDESWWSQSKKVGKMYFSMVGGIVLIILIILVQVDGQEKFRDGWLNLPVTGLATTIWSVAASNICIIAIIGMISDGLSHAALLCLEAGK